MNNNNIILSQKSSFINLLKSYLQKQNCLLAFISLGLVLIKSPFTVIDIGNYQKNELLNSILASMLKKGAYIEVSPSGKDLHIFYQCTWNHEKNKGLNPILSNNIYTTCEVYIGKDIRFITLTGQQLLDVSQIYGLPIIFTVNILTSDKLKFFYYHFCLLTTPGGNPVSIYVKDLLAL